MDNDQKQEGLDLADARLSDPQATRSLLDDILGRPTADAGQPAGQSGDALAGNSAPPQPSLEEIQRKNAELESALNEYRARETHQQAQQREQVFAQNQQMWAAAEQKIWQDVDNLEPSEAKRVLGEFYNQRSANERQIAAALVQQMAVSGYKQKIAEDFGLSPEELALIRDDPRTMDSDLRHVMAMRERFNSLEDEIRSARAQNTATSRVRSGVHSMGGTGAVGTGAPKAEPEKGSIDHLLQILTS